MIAIALAAALLSACSGGGSDVVRGDGGTPSVGQSGNQAAGATAVTVIVDGWSAMLLRNPVLAMTAGTASADVTLRPATLKDLRSVAKIAPEAIEALAARLATSDRSLQCSAESCRTASGDLPFSALLAPTELAETGPTFTTWGMAAGAYIATITVPADAPSLRLAVPGNDAAGYSFELPASDDAEGIEELPDNGWNRGVYAAGVGFGRVFPITASWLAGEAHWVGRQPGEAPATAPVLLSPPFVAGPGVAEPAAGTLTPSQLTVLSSPTTGCGFTAACTPMPTFFASVTASKALKVCSADGTALPAQVIDATWRGSLPGPTQLGGVWNGLTALPQPNERRALWDGRAPDADGELELRVVTLYIFDSLGLLNVGTSVAQVGRDSVQTVERPLDEHVTRLAGGRTVCS